jgi:hypothetical protein
MFFMGRTLQKHAQEPSERCARGHDYDAGNQNPDEHGCENNGSREKTRFERKSEEPTCNIEPHGAA